MRVKNNSTTSKTQLRVKLVLRGYKNVMETASHEDSFIFQNLYSRALFLPADEISALPT